MSRLAFLSISACLCLGMPRPCEALTVVIDYSADAATDISALLSPTLLTAISPSGTPNVDSISGTSGSTTVTANWDFVYTNPSTGVDVILPSPTVASDTIRIFVGMDQTVLGEGGPGSAGVSLGASGFPSQL